MIKEITKQSKYNISKTKKQIVLEYTRTFFLSILAAAIVTTFLVWHARCEVLQDMTASKSILATSELAQEILNKANFINELPQKSYAQCMQIAKLYESVGDYDKAIDAYKIAIEKAKRDVYTAHLKLVEALIIRNRIQEAEKLLELIPDDNNKRLIKFKTRAYIIIGDRYYSLSKFISALKNYEKANYYYTKLPKKDKEVIKQLDTRIVNSYIKIADLMVNNNMSKEAVFYLLKAENSEPENMNIKYKLALIYSDTNPPLAIPYLERLLEVCPQMVDHNLYNNTYMRSANIADLEGQPTVAKYYRYRVYSIDMYLRRKAVYKNDIDVMVDSIKVNKHLFTYPIDMKLKFINASGIEINNMRADFILCRMGKPVSTITKKIATKKEPLYSNGDGLSIVDLYFNNKIFTRQQLAEYSVRIYAYKEDKYKTELAEIKIPTKSIVNKKH